MHLKRRVMQTDVQIHNHSPIDTIYRHHPHHNHHQKGTWTSSLTAPPHTPAPTTPAVQTVRVATCQIC